MNKNYNKEIDTLDNELKLLIDSGMSIKEFIKRRLFEKYAETGDERIKDIAADYFIDKMDDPTGK